MTTSSLAYRDVGCSGYEFIFIDFAKTDPTSYKCPVLSNLLAHAVTETTYATTLFVDKGCNNDDDNDDNDRDMIDDFDAATCKDGASANELSLLLLCNEFDTTVEFKTVLTMTTNTTRKRLHDILGSKPLLWKKDDSP
jgi:hypothetical protein